MQDINDRLYQQLAAKLRAQLQLLPDKPEETVDACLRALWAHAAGFPVAVSAAADVALRDLSAEQRDRLQAAVKERLSGVPLAHITGRQEFMGIELLAGKSALIPRRETEILGALALGTIDEISLRVDQPLVIDVCTGCGNLALALLKHRPGIQVWGADLSENAIALARKNAVHLGLDSQIKFLVGDLLAPFDSPDFRDRVDLITCNPPYILSSNLKTMAPEIAEHEPEMAFNGGPFGIKILDRVIKESAQYLKPGGWLCLELGAGQGPFVEKRITKSGLYCGVDVAYDKQQVVRALRARLKEQ